MKKVKGFKVGDKVFAKVKGYPAWPAVITQDQITKYNVQFYGTGETGVVKSKDLFYYLKYKNTYTKSIKRKDYHDAIQEIEKAIKECGTDGNDDKADLTNINETIDDNKGNKRKRSISSDKSVDVPVKKKLLDDTLTDSTDEKSEVNVEDHSEVEIVNKENLQPTKETREDLIGGSEEDDEEDANKKSEIDKGVDKNEIDTVNRKQNDFKLSIDDIYPVPVYMLNAIIAWANHVRQKPDIFKKKPVEKRYPYQNQVVLAKLPSGNYIPIKYNRGKPPSCENELEMAEYDEAEAKKGLALKAKIENGSYKPEENPDLFEIQLNLTYEHVQEIMEKELIERKKLQVQWLKRESTLVQLDGAIKTCLGLDKADPKMALGYLDKMLQLEIEPINLKKNPEIVDMIKRLRRYIGNVKEWNLSDEELENFHDDARAIRQKATEVFKKFIKSFNMTDETIFWDFYIEEVENFKDLTADMHDKDVFFLTAEPDSRQAFLDKLDEGVRLECVEIKAED